MKDTASENEEKVSLSEDDLMKKLNGSLQQRADSLDIETIAELDKIRQKVVAQTEKLHASWFMQPAYGGILAACLVVAISIFTFYPEQDRVVGNESDLEIVLVNNDFELFTEDLEFYQWLEDENA